MKTVYILGAGATIGHTDGRFPGINTFFTEANKLKSLEEEYLYTNLITYLSDSRNFDLSKNKTNINIEELLTLFLINEEYKHDIEDLNLSRELIQFIKNTINAISKSLVIKKSEYDRFVEHIDDSDSIITFNWDVLLDNVLERENQLAGKKNWIGNQYGNFLQHLSGYRGDTALHKTIKKPYYDEDYIGDIGYYIKLHGSVDWLACTNRSCRAYGEIFPMLDHGLAYCSECHEYVDELIIPPIINKQYRSYPSLQRLWTLASIEIQHAQRIVIWGYSLPPTDFYSNWLLRQSEHWLKSVDLIDPDCIKRTSTRVLWNRKYIEKYADIFYSKGRKANVLYYENLNDFIKKLNVKQKYDLKET